MPRVACILLWRDDRMLSVSLDAMQRELEEAQLMCFEYESLRRQPAPKTTRFGKSAPCSERTIAGTVQNVLKTSHAFEAELKSILSPVGVFPTSKLAHIWQKRRSCGLTVL